LCLGGSFSVLSDQIEAVLSQRLVESNRDARGEIEAANAVRANGDEHGLAALGVDQFLPKAVGFTSEDKPVAALKSHEVVAPLAQIGEKPASLCRSRAEKLVE